MWFSSRQGKSRYLVSFLSKHIPKLNQQQLQALTLRPMNKKLPWRRSSYDQTVQLLSLLTHSLLTSIKTKRITNKKFETTKSFYILHITNGIWMFTIPYLVEYKDCMTAFKLSPFFSLGGCCTDLFDIYH